MTDTSFEETLLTVAGQLHQRITAAGDDPSNRVAKADDLIDQLRRVDPARAAAVAPTIEAHAATTAARIESAGQRQGDTTHVARVMASRSGDLLEAAITSTSTAETAARLDDAAQAVRAVQEEIVAAHAKLEQAVTNSDIDTVMTVRPIVEVTLPGKLDLLDEQLAAHRAALETAQTLHALASDAQAKLEKRVAAARRALEQAEHERDTAAAVTAMADDVRNRRRAAVGERESERITLADNIAGRQHDRFRRLAGLDTSAVAENGPLETAVA